MSQPVRKSVVKPKEEKPSTGTKKKFKRTPRAKTITTQPSRTGEKKKKVVKRTVKVHTITEKQRNKIYQAKGKKFGTSKLEDKFAREFLDKLGIEYVRQWPMGNTGRFVDFAIKGHNILIEVDGDYFHGYGRLYENMDAMQKKNYNVDKYKNQWALENNFKMVRFWEHEIKNEGTKVMKRLKILFGISDKRKTAQK